MRWRLRLARLAALFARQPGRHPAAFASLHGVSVEGLDCDDGVIRITVPWQGVTRITVAMGRQTYDRTPVLTIAHAAGRTIFVPEGDACWAALLAAMPCHLPGALPAATWLARLSGDPDATIRIL